MNTNGVSQSVSTIGMSALIGSKQVTQTMIDNVQSSTERVEIALAEQEKQIFNQKFEMYKGEKVRGTLVRSLLSNVIMSNTLESDDDERVVTVKLEGNKINKPSNWNTQGENDSTKLYELRDSVKASAEYNVVIEYNTKGLVKNITITEK